MALASTAPSCVADGNDRGGAATWRHPSAPSTPSGMPLRSVHRPAWASTWPTSSGRGRRA